MTTAVSNYLGEVGEKVANIPVSIRYAKYNAAEAWNRSATMFIVAESDAGQLIKISGSGQSLFDVKRGDQVVIVSAKVKDHGEYRGQAQTSLGWVKIEKQAEEIEEAAAEDETEWAAMRFMSGPPIQDMTTTFGKFANAKRRNYESLPTNDVEILPDVQHCDKCGELVTYEPGGGTYGLGKWNHKDPNVEDHGYVGPKTRCRYCHSEKHAVYRQHAWYDAVECSRCGGVDGHAIGD